MSMEYREMKYHEFRAMNSDILLAAEGSPSQLAVGFEKVQAFVEQSEARFTRFSDQSELARLNGSAGGWFQASPELFDLLLLARRYNRETGGLFNPAVLEALENAGYDRSMDEIRARGVVRVTKQANLLVPDFQAIQLERSSRKVYLPAGMRVDLGGIAKGWIAEQAAGVLRRYAQACAVSAGGDMFLSGLPSGEPTWQVALEDPRAPEQNLAVLNVTAGAVATSSITKRRWQQGQRTQNHIIDPRSGEPVETDWLSVTVVHPQAAGAEVFAKALLIAGSAGWESLNQSNQEIIAIAVDGKGQIWGSEKSMELINVTNAIAA
jgi:thiamine biosynthesis lipoprotein